MELSRERFAGWLPIRIGVREGSAFLEWCYGGDTPLASPLVDLDIGALMGRPFNQLFRRTTPLDALTPFESALSEVRPAGLLFHISRCGSTLLARLLRALPGHLVYSEPMLLEQLTALLAANPQLPPELVTRWLRSTFGALAHYGTPQASRLFVKFDPWSIHTAPLLAELFPDTPRIFLYRDPIEVLVSQQRTRATQMIPGVLPVQALGLDFEQALQLSPERYTARVLAAICRQACALAERGELQLVHYSELAAEAPALIEQLFGLKLDGPQRERLAAESHFDSKAPGLRFTPDGEEKRRAAGDALRRLADEELYPLFHRLEALRAAQIGARRAGAAA